MDLELLRQLRSHSNPFVRGSDAFDQTATELAAIDPGKVGAVPKKSVRDE